MEPVKLDKCLEELTVWIKEQDELPQSLDKILLIRYLKATEFDVERSKVLLRNSLKMRHKNPHIFTQRDPHSKEMRNVVEVVQLVPMIHRTPENYNVSIYRLTDNDPDKIIFNDVIKAFYMAADTRLITTEEVWADGEIPIYDMTNITLRHFTKVVFSTLRLFMKYSQEAHPVIVRQIHIVNCTTLLNRVMMVIKPFLNQEVAERIQTHLPGSETLYKYVPKEILPKEYGGYCGPIDYIKNFWLERLDIHRDYLNNEENWRLNY